MFPLKDILDRLIGGGASTTVAGAGIGGFLYELVQQLFPGAAKAAQTAPTNPTDFVVWIVLIVAGMVIHKPGDTLPPADEPQ